MEVSISLALTLAIFTSLIFLTHTNGTLISSKLKRSVGGSYVVSSQYPNFTSDSISFCNYFSYGSSQSGVYNVFNQPTGYLSTNTLLAGTYDVSATYPANTTCTWYITAPSPDTQIKVSLEYFSTACASDWLTITDLKSDTVLAQLCGDRMSFGQNYSSAAFPSTYLIPGPAAKISFSSSSDGFFPGFGAYWSYIPDNPLCNTSTSAPCLHCSSCDNNGSSLTCKPGFTGSFCEFSVPPFSNASNFSSPRFLHSATWHDPSSSLLIYGGSNLRGEPLKNEATTFISYSYASSETRSLPVNGGPGFRYGHTAFLFNGEYYIYGGTGFNSTNVLSDESQRILRNISVFNLGSQNWVELATNVSRISYEIDTDPNSHTSLVINGPLSIINATYVPVINQAQLADSLFIFGGAYRFLGETRNLADILQYDLHSNEWQQFASFGAITPSGGFSSGTGLYHAGTNSFYIFNGINGDAGYPVYITQLSATVKIPMMLNYNTLSPMAFPTDYYRSNVTMQDIGDDMVLFFGGYNPLDSSVNNSCFLTDVRIYDIACREWVYSSLAGESPVADAIRSPRASAPAVYYKNNSDGIVLISAGNNGQPLLDLLTLNLTTFNLDENSYQQARRNVCRASRCSDFQYSCRDCLALPNCHFCGGQCTYRSQLLNVPSSSLETVGNCYSNQSSCPVQLASDQAVMVNTTILQTIPAYSSVTLQTYVPTQNFYGNLFATLNNRINFNLYDMALYVTSISPSNAQVVVTLQNYLSNVTSDMIQDGVLSSTVSLNNRYAIFSLGVRQPGLIVYSILNNQSATPVSVTFKVVPIVYYNSNSNSDSWLLSLPIIFCVLIGALTVGLASSFAARRCRGNQIIGNDFALFANQRIQRAQNTIAVPDWWHVQLLPPGKQKFHGEGNLYESLLRDEERLIVKSASMQLDGAMQLGNIHHTNSTFSKPLAFETYFTVYGEQAEDEAKESSSSLLKETKDVKSGNLESTVQLQADDEASIKSNLTEGNTFLATHHVVLLPSQLYSNLAASKTSSEANGQKKLGNFMLGASIYVYRE